MTLLYGALLTVHALTMGMDELIFHRRRGLPRWERIGHPLDSLTVLIPVLIAAFLSRENALSVFVGLAIFSCVFVMKDEAVHQREAGPGEHFFHAALFVMHPIFFWVVDRLWIAEARQWLLGLGVSVAVWMIYQIVYWNVRRTN